MMNKNLCISADVKKILVYISCGRLIYPTIFNHMPHLVSGQYYFHIRTFYSNEDDKILITDPVLRMGVVQF